MKNIAVVGTGYWGKNLVRNFHALNALHTVCDINQDAVTSFCEQYPGLNGVTSFAEILSNLSRYGEQMALPLEGEGSFECPHTGQRYLLQNGTVIIEK